MENKLKRFMSLTLALLMVFSMMPQISLGASAASTRTIYLNAGGSSLWDQANAWFAVHAWSGSAYEDVPMTKDSTTGYYYAEINSAYTSLLFVRMNPSYSSFDWNGKWNQTGDLTVSGTNNLFTITGWDYGTWSHYHTYTSVVTAPDCVNAGYTTYTCSSCGDSYTEAGEAATGHSFANGDETCDNCDEPNPNNVAPETTIDTLEELQAALETANSTITVGGVITIPTGTDVYLNLNGCTVNFGEYYIDNKGTLTISGSGSLIADTFNDTTNGAPIVSTGNLTVSGGTISGVCAAVRVEGGFATIENDANLKTTGKSGYSACIIRMKGGALTIKGGTLTGCNSTNGSEGCVLINATGGTTEITGGIFYDYASAPNSIFATGTGVTVKGGTFTSTATEGYTVAQCLANYLADSYVVNEDGTVELAPASGTLGTSYISESDDRATIYGEVTGMTNAKESIVVKLYSGETLLATTTLANLDYLSSETLGVNIVISGRASSSWNTVWEEGHPVASHCPDKAVLYIDGVEQNTANVTLGTIDDLGEPYVWAEIEGVSPVIYKVTTYEELVAALENDNAHVLMMNDITGTATQSSGYGKAGIVLNAGDVLDGNGYTLTINGANATWDCAIAMKGGEVKNLTIAGAMRGVFMPGANGDVVIDNCVFKDVIYTFNSDAGSKDYSVTIKNTTLNGWTSFSDVHGSVTFDTCSFGEGSGYAFCRPYQATTFTNCSFAEGFKLDTTQTADNTLAFNSCTYAGEAISANNSAMFYNGGSVMINGVATDVTNYPAYIGETGYETFEAALNAVADGETITLLNVEGSEIDKEIDFTKAISFTITGTAPNYELPVVTFQNATVTIKDAEILIPELDARQNATINVVDSKVLDAGGNSIVKSYYNGAINISGTSVVHTMQVTTMGYITVSGTAVLNAAWQTNVYGNGLITVAEGATFNTAALQLTAQEYSGRDNTDADRVGKPAQITVAGTLNVGSVQSSNGADYSYNSSCGINIGTIEGEAALLDIKSGATVNIYMANGETANIGADGTVNVAGTVTVSCRSENGTATVTNNGSIVLTDAAATVTANECGKVTTTVTGYDVTYADGAYSLTAKTPDFETAGILESSGKVRITADIYDLYNVDTFEAKLYDQNGELLTTVTPAVELNYAETTLSIMILGDSSSWDQTDWTPTSAQRPDYIEIWVNGELAATVDVRDNVVGMGELTQEKWDALLGKYYPVAKIGDTGYATLQAAIDAAVNGDTITLVADCAEDVTVVQAENVKITIDGNSKTMSGTITVNGQSHAYDTAGLTIKNVKFDATNISKDASINLGGSNNTRYTNHVTVEDCSFTGTENAKVGIKNYTGGCKNLTVTDCTATGLHSLIQVKGVDGITVTNVTVENCKNGISVGPSTNVVIENANITAEGYGIRADGTAAYNVTVKNSTISADLPIVVRNNTAEGYNLTLEGTNSLAASNENGYQVIFTSGDDGTYEVPAVEFNLTGAEGLKVFPAYVAQIGDVKYGTVTEAVEAAKPGDTIELIADAEEASVILLDGIDLDLYGHTLTVTGYIAAYDGNNIIDTDGNGLLKITKGKIMIQDDNTYLPIWDDTNKGYVFANCENFKEQTNVGDNSVTYIFLPELEGADYELIAKGIEVSGVTMKVEASWTRSDGTLGTATFTYTDALMQQFYSKYDAETDKFGSAFTLILTGTEGKTLSYKVYFVSDTGVTYECN